MAIKQPPRQRLLRIAHFSHKEQLLLLGFRLFAAAVLVVLSWQLFQSLRRMAVRMRGGSWVCRDQQPKLFWSLIAFQCWMIFIFLGVLFFLPT